MQQEKSDEKRRPTPVVAYAAKSTEDLHGSIKTQIEDCRALAEREGWEIVCVFTDENKSAYHGNRGPGLIDAKRLAVSTAAERGECILLAQESDRFARGAGDAPGAADHLGELFFAMRRQGVVLWSVRSGELDLLRAALEGERSHDETARKADGVAKGIRRVKDRGKPWGGVPCGYRIERTIIDEQVVSKRAIDPATEPTVQAIFAMVEAGQSWSPIARALNARGLRTQRGNPWMGPVVRDLARNPIYVGEKGYPPIIDRERWENVQALIDASNPVRSQRRHGGRPVVSDRFLLQGLGFCARCGSPMYLNDIRDGYYVCRDRRRGTGLCRAKPVPRRLADERVAHHLGTFVGGVKRWITARVAERDDEHQAHEQALRTEQAALTDMERLRAKLLAEYECQVADGRSTAYLALEAVERKDSELEAQRQKVQATEALMAEWEPIPDVDAALGYYRDLVDAIRGRISGASSVREVNATLSTIIAGIWISYDGQRLDASFALRPLDGRDDVGGLAQALSHSEPGKRFALKPPLADEPDLADTSGWILGVGLAKTQD
jgi:DNA invertase Pin-like site-specific DNA recombinase